MKTKDTGKATKLTRAMRTGLDELEAKLDAVSSRMKVFGDLTPKEHDRLEKGISQNVAALSSKQRQLMTEAGRTIVALNDMETHETSVAFMTARLGADFRFKENIGQDYDSNQRDLAGAEKSVHRPSWSGKVMRCASLERCRCYRPPAADVVLGLRALLEKPCTAKGYYQHGNDQELDTGTV